MKLSEVISQIEVGLEALKAEVARTEAQEGAAALPLPPIVIPQGFAIGGMSLFGLNWDGSDDEGDEAPDGSPLKGAWGDVTHSKTVVACALPIPVLSETFGSTAKPLGYKVNVYSLATNKLMQAPILDKGPAVRVRRPIDGTWALHSGLGHMDYGLKRFSSFKKFPATFPVIIWIQDQHGLTKPIVGWDNVLGEVI